MRISDWSSDVCSSDLRKLAKELHPDRNKDNPKASERFSQVTNAYDLLTDKDKRARFDRGEIDADGNPTSPFGFGGGGGGARSGGFRRSEEHTSELQSLMRISYAVFCLKKKSHSYSKVL